MRENIVQPRTITNKNLIGKIFYIWIDIIVNDIIKILKITDKDKIKDFKKIVILNYNFKYIIYNKLRNYLINN